MARQGWGAMRDLMTLQERMNRLFEEAADRHGRPGDDGGEIERAEWVPLADVYEDERGYVVALDLPGISREGLDVSLDEGRLTVRGERAPLPEAARSRRAERPSGRFLRSFTLPDDVERKGISADYKDGVLLLRLPRRREPPSRRVSIKIQ